MFAQEIMHLTVSYIFGTGSALGPTPFTFKTPDPDFSLFYSKVAII